MEIRKPLRLPQQNYAAPGVYFITICTKNRRPCLWQPSADGTYAPARDAVPVGAHSARPPAAPPLSSTGEIVQRAIANIPAHYPSLSIDHYIIMPNHIHILLRVSQTNGRTLCAPTISRIIKHLKEYVTKQLGEPIWQRSFYDHIIRDEQDYRNKYEYITDNPRRWMEDVYHVP